MRIVADRHEKNSMVIAELVSNGVDVDFNSLEVADFVISNEIAVERKTINDFVSSMIDKRLVNQLINLRNNYKNPLLIIEGIEEQDLYKSARFDIHGNSIRGMILSAIMDFNVPVIFTNNCKDTADYLALLVKKQENPNKEISLNAKRKASSLSEQQQFIVEGFPGIGPALAKSLLKKFETIQAIANAEKEELKKAEKVNDSKADKIHKLFREKYITD